MLNENAVFAQENKQKLPYWVQYGKSMHRMGEKGTYILLFFWMMCCISNRKQNSTKWVPSVAIAVSILVKQRNTQMNATACIYSGKIKLYTVCIYLSRQTITLLYFFVFKRHFIKDFDFVSNWNVHDFILSVVTNDWMRALFDFWHIIIPLQTFLGF